jgi:hypothetical protein
MRFKVICITMEFVIAWVDASLFGINIAGASSKLIYLSEMLKIGCGYIIDNENFLQHTLPSLVELCKCLLSALTHCFFVFIYFIYYFFFYVCVYAGEGKKVLFRPWLSFMFPNV